MSDEQMSEFPALLISFRPTAAPGSAGLNLEHYNAATVSTHHLYPLGPQLPQALQGLNPKHYNAGTVSTRHK